MNTNLGKINLDLKPHKPTIMLAKPNRDIISKLSEAHNIQTKENYGGVNEISFNIPYYLTKNHKTVRNKNVDLVKGHYLLKIDNEWYIITNPKKTGASGKEVLEISAFSLAYSLRDKRISVYVSDKDPETDEPRPVNCDKVMNDILQGTGWSKGYVDAEFNLMYRSFDINEKTVLECIQHISESFDALVIYDSKEKRINMYKEENIGIDKGLVIKYGKYLKTIGEQPNFDEVCTRLYAYGKDGMTFNDVNPSGQAYVDNYGYYMHPYDETITNVANDTYVVNESSKYMSDELCHGIIKNNKAIKDSTPVFKTLLEQLKALNLDLDGLENELDKLEDELAIIEDNLDIENKTSSMNKDTNLIEYPDSKRAKLVVDRDNKKAEVQSKIHEIESKLSQIDGKYLEIDELQETLSPNNFFTQPVLNELTTYIIEKKWSNNSIVYTNDLYERVGKEMGKVSQPVIKYDIGIVDFLNVVDCQVDWDKLNLGDIVTVKYDALNIEIQAKITQISRNFDKNDIKLTIANAKNIKDGFYALKDFVKNEQNTSTILDLSKFKWESGGTSKGKIEELIDSLMDRNKEKVLTGNNEHYTLDRTGMTFYDPDDPLNYLRILHNVLAFTNDGGNTFKTAVSPSGVVAEYLYGKVITGVNLIIGDADGTMEILGNKGIVTDWLDRIVMKWGMYDGYQTEGYHADDKFGLELTRYEGTTENTMNTITLDAEEGFFIKKYMKEGNRAGQYRNTAWLDINGNFWLEEVTARRMTITNGNDDPIIEVGVDVSDTRLDIEKFDEILTDGVLSPLEKYQVRSEWKMIKAEYIKLQMHHEKYDLIDREDEKGIHQTLNEWNAYDSAYKALEIYLAPFFVDMEKTTAVERSDFEYAFETYFKAMKDLVQAIENSMKKSSLQLGMNYNNVVIDAISGITVTRTDGIVKTVLNATDGIYIERSGDKVFYVDTYGTLHAVDLVADRLILRDANGDVVIDANSGFLNLNAFNQIQGTLPADNVFAGTIMADTGIINDLTVNRLMSLYLGNEGTTSNFIDIQEQFARWVRADIGQGEAWTSEGYDQETGEPSIMQVYWTDATRQSTTFENTGIPVYKQTISNAETKMQLSFGLPDPDSSVLEPAIYFGENIVTMRDKSGIIQNIDGMKAGLWYQNRDGWNGMYMSYFTNEGTQNRITLGENDITIYSEVDYVENEKGRVHISTRHKDALIQSIPGDEVPLVIAKRIIIPASFAGKNGVQVNLPQTLQDEKYGVVVTPTSDADGFRGEYWITGKTASGFKVHNSGTSGGTFEAVVII